MRKIAICLIILYLSPCFSQDLNSKIDTAQILNKYQSYLSSQSLIIDKSNPCKSPGWNFLTSQKVNLNTCSDLNAALTALASDRITVVYASSYYSNPASVFGHLFLLFRNIDEPKFMNLTVNFAAQVSDDISAIEYVYHGISGGFNGTYSILPFYHKVEEYNNIEDRDLWFYQLNLTEEEVLLFKLLLYDQRQLDSAYYFLNRNCADKIYSLLTIVKNIQTPTHPLYFTPLESIKLIHKNIGTNHTYYRPSLRKLSLNLKDYTIEGSSPQITALDEEIFMNEYLYKSRKQRVYLDQQLRAQTTRAQIHQSSSFFTEINLVEDTNSLADRSTAINKVFHNQIRSWSPEKSHDEREVFISNQNNKSNLGFTIYAHDLLDFHAGYNTYSQLRLGSILLNAEDFENIELFNFWSIQPHHAPDWSISYRAELKFNPELNSRLQVGLSDTWMNMNYYFLTGVTNHFEYNPNEKRSIYLVSTLGLFSHYQDYRFSGGFDFYTDFPGMYPKPSLALEARYYSSKNLHFDLHYKNFNNLKNSLYFLVSMKF